MKKNCKVFVVVIAAVILFGGILQTQNAYAAKTSNKAAKAAFKEFLSSPSTAYNWERGTNLNNLSFISFDAGKGSKKVPMLIVKNSFASHAKGYIGLFQYSEGRVKEVCKLDWVEKIYPRAGIIAACYSGGGYGEVHTYYYKVKNKKSLAKQVAYTAILDESTYKDSSYAKWLRKMFGKDIYRIGSKKTTKLKFQKWLAKQVKGSNKITNINGKLLKNTQENRDRYFR